MLHRSGVALHYERVVLGGPSDEFPTGTTCLHAASSFLAVGTADGKVFLYREHAQRGLQPHYKLLCTAQAPDLIRSSCTCIQLFPHRDSVALAVGTRQGVIIIFEMERMTSSGSGLVPKLALKHVVRAHLEAIEEVLPTDDPDSAASGISCILWVSHGHGRSALGNEIKNSVHLFSASRSGTVVLTIVVLSGVAGALQQDHSPSWSKIWSPTRSGAQLQSQSQLLLHEHSAIVQMDLCGTMLLLSSRARCLTLNLNTSGNQNPAAVQVGERPRDGKYGGCFAYGSDGSDSAQGAAVLLARPGRRLWLADGHSGKVSVTLRLPSPNALIPLARGADRENENDRFGGDTGGGDVGTGDGHNDDTSAESGQSCIATDQKASLPAAQSSPDTSLCTFSKLALFTFLPPTAGRAAPQLLSWGDGCKHSLSLIDLQTQCIVACYCDLGTIHDLSLCEHPLKARGSASSFFLAHSTPTGTHVAFVQAIVVERVVASLAPIDLIQAVQIAVHYHLSSATLLRELHDRWISAQTKGTIVSKTKIEPQVVAKFERLVVLAAQAAARSAEQDQVQEPEHDDNKPLTEQLGMSCSSTAHGDIVIEGEDDTDVMPALEPNCSAATSMKLVVSEPNDTSDTTFVAARVRVPASENDPHEGRESLLDRGMTATRRRRARPVKIANVPISPRHEPRLSQDSIKADMTSESQSTKTHDVVNQQKFRSALALGGTTGRGRIEHRWICSRCSTYNMLSDFQCTNCNVKFDAPSSPVVSRTQEEWHNTPRQALRDCSQQLQWSSPERIGHDAETEAAALAAIAQTVTWRLSSRRTLLAQLKNEIAMEGPKDLPQSDLQGRDRPSSNLTDGQHHDQPPAPPLSAMQRYFARDLRNQMVLWKRSQANGGRNSSFEDYLRDQFPENIRLNTDGSVCWIDPRVMGQQWLGTFLKVRASDRIESLGPVPQPDDDAGDYSRIDMPGKDRTGTAHSLSATSTGTGVSNAAETTDGNASVASKFSDSGAHSEGAVSTPVKGGVNTVIATEPEAEIDVNGMESCAPSGNRLGTDDLAGGAGQDGAHRATSPRADDVASALRSLAQAQKSSHDVAQFKRLTREAWEIAQIHRDCGALPFVAAMLEEWMSAMEVMAAAGIFLRPIDARAGGDADWATVKAATALATLCCTHLLQTVRDRCTQLRALSLARITAADTDALLEASSQYRCGVVFDALVHGDTGASKSKARNNGASVAPLQALRHALSRSASPLPGKATRGPHADTGAMSDDDPSRAGQDKDETQDIHGSTAKSMGTAKHQRQRLSAVAVVTRQLEGQRPKPQEPQLSLVMLLQLLPDVARCTHSIGQLADACCKAYPRICPWSLHRALVRPRGNISDDEDRSAGKCNDDVEVRMSAVYARREHARPLLKLIECYAERILEQQPHLRSDCEVLFLRLAASLELDRDKQLSSGDGRQYMAPHPTEILCGAKSVLSRDGADQWWPFSDNPDLNTDTEPIDSLHAAACASDALAAAEGFDFSFMRSVDQSAVSSAAVAPRRSRAWWLENLPTMCAQRGKFMPMVRALCLRFSHAQSLIASYLYEQPTGVDRRYVLSRRQDDSGCADATCEPLPLRTRVLAALSLACVVGDVRGVRRSLVRARELDQGSDCSLVTESIRRFSMLPKANDSVVARQRIDPGVFAAILMDTVGTAQACDLLAKSALVSAHRKEEQENGRCEMTQEATTATSLPQLTLDVCGAEAILHKHALQLRRDRAATQLLAAVDKHMWTARACERALPPQVLYMCNSDVENHPVGSSVSAIETMCAAKQSTDRATDEGARAVVEPHSQNPDIMHGPCLEEAEGHWGSIISMDGAASRICSACGLPLYLPEASADVTDCDEDVTVQTRGNGGYDSISADTATVTFRCQHSFHRCCVPQMACLLCFERNFCLTQN